MLEVLSYMHDKQICHRDIKLDNLIYDKNKQVKIIDFGFAISSKDRLKNYCGTPSYMAPELIQKKGDYSGPAADIWATGVVLYTLLTGCFPFRGKDEK